MIARDLHVSRSTISSWIQRFNEGGIRSLTGRNKRSPLIALKMRRDISLRDIRRAAYEAKEMKQWRTARRLASVALVLEGIKLADVASKFEVSISSVSKWCKIFNRIGVRGLIGTRAVSGKGSN